MKIKPVLRCAFILSSASIWVLPASAVCNPPKFVSTYNIGTYQYCYWHSSLNPSTLTLHADIWSGPTNHTGTCNTSPGILYFGAIPGDFGINISLGDACAVGCPVGSLSILASATDGIRTQTLVAQAPETPNRANHFDFSETGPRPLAPYPRPQVTSISRVGNDLLLSFLITGISVYDGAGSGITGFNILATTSNSDPGRSANAYGFSLFVPSPGGGGAGTVLGDCPDNPPNDVWLVTQIVTTAGPSPIVSESTRIRCWILAEPTRKIDRKMGTQTDN